MYSACVLGIEGINPVATSFKLGFANMISIKKENPITIINPIINASIFRIPNRCKKSNNIVSNDVITTPHNNGTPVNK